MELINYLLSNIQLTFTEINNQYITIYNINYTWKISLNYKKKKK